MHVPDRYWVELHVVVHAAQAVLAVGPDPWQAETWYWLAVQTVQAVHARLVVLVHVPVR